MAEPVLTVFTQSLSYQKSSVQLLFKKTRAMTCTPYITDGFAATQKYREVYKLNHNLIGFIPQYPIILFVIN
jgi:hypothetical protein